MKILNFELGEKLDQYFDVKFDEESEFDSFKSKKSSHLKPKNENCLLEITRNLKNTCLFWLEARLAFCD